MLCYSPRCYYSPLFHVASLYTYCGDAIVHVRLERATARGCEIETCGAYIKTINCDRAMWAVEGRGRDRCGSGEDSGVVPVPTALSTPRLIPVVFPYLFPFFSLIHHLLSSTCQAIFSRKERSPSLAPAQLVIVARLYHPMVILIPTSPRQASHPS